MKGCNRQSVASVESTRTCRILFVGLLVCVFIGSCHFSIVEVIGSLFYKSRVTNSMAQLLCGNRELKFRKHLKCDLVTRHFGSLFVILKIKRTAGMMTRLC